MLAHLLTWFLHPESSYAKLSLSPSKAGQTRNHSHSKILLKRNNIAPSSIPSIAHCRSSPGMVHFLEMYSDDDDDGHDDDDDEEDDDEVEEDDDDDYGAERSQST